MNFRISILYISLCFSLFIAHCSFLIAQDTLPINIIHLDSTINSKFCEFSPLKLKDSVLYFSSIRPDADESIESFIKTNFICKIYSVKKTGGVWSSPKLINSIINTTGLNNANISFAPNHMKFYFSRENAEDISGKITSIYVCHFKKGTWQKPEKLPGIVNLKDYSSTQPVVAELPDGNEILYFSSDRPGGIGKKDIWYTTLIDGQYAEPINLGPNINSTGDDITPFYHQGSGTLYYSSDGFNGLGGYDIYKSKGFKNTWNKSVHPGEPLNTKYDEINFTVNELDTNGYLASNRPGSYFISEQVSCYDIYEYTWKKKPKPPEIVVQKIDTVEKLQISKLTLSKDSAINTQLSALTLYFDNDQPDPRTLKIKTDSNYTDLLKNYITKRDKYIKTFTDVLSGKEKETTQKQIKSFFDTIQYAEFRIQQFSEKLLDLLNKNCDITLEISGFCSPLHTTAYNFNLSKRRISSFILCINHFQNGVFTKYINQSSENAGKLRLVEIPEGKSKAPSAISDNPKDIRNSIYSPAASAERKLYIELKVNSCNLYK